MNPIEILKITIQCFLVNGNDIWFVPEEAGVLCKYNLEVKQIVLMRIIPNDTARKYAYKAIIKYQNKLVLIPGMAEKIVVYDMDMELFREIELPVQKVVCLRRAKFIYGFGKGYYIYLIPESYPYFLRIDMRNYEVIRSENIAQSCRDFFNISNIKMFFSALAWDGDNTVYSGITASDGERTYGCLGKMELQPFQFNAYKLSYGEKEIKGMVWHKEHLFLYTAEENIIVLDQNMRMLKRISVNTIQDDNVDAEDERVALANIYVCDDKMYFIRRSKQEAVILDLRDNNKVSERKLIDEWIRQAGNTNHGMLIQPLDKGCFYLGKKGTYEKYFFQTERKVIQNCYRQMVTDYKESLYEDEIFQVSEWKELVSDSMKQGQTGKSSGKEIYQYIMKDYGG